MGDDASQRRPKYPNRIEHLPSEKAQEINEWLALCLEAGRAEAWDVDLATGKKVRIGNHAALFGVAADEETPQSFWRSVHPQDRDPLRQPDATMSPSRWSSE